jgi:hypothetical protein
VILLQASHVELPTWPNNLFQIKPRNHLVDGIIDHKDVGLTGLALPPKLQPSEFVFHPQLDWLRQIGALSISKKYCWMTISISDVLKAKIRDAATTEDTLKLLSELAVLISYSMPNAYAESLWKSLCLALREPIQNDLLPFLAVAHISLLRENV